MLLAGVQVMGQPASASVGARIHTTSTNTSSSSSLYKGCLQGSMHHSLAVCLQLVVGPLEVAQAAVAAVSGGRLAGNDSKQPCPSSPLQILLKKFL